MVSINGGTPESFILIGFSIVRDKLTRVALGAKASQSHGRSLRLARQPAD